MNTGRRDEWFAMTGPKQLRPLLVAIALSLSAVGCLSRSAMQTGRALPDNTGEFLVSGGGWGTMFGTFCMEGPCSSGYHPYPYAQLGYRRGVGNGWDLGIRATSLPTLLLEAKRQVIGTQRSTFALALGVSLSTHFPTFVTELALPVYISVHPHKIVAVYLVPRVSLLGPVSRDHYVTPLGGGSLGVRIGRYMGVMVEATSVFHLAPVPEPGVVDSTEFTVGFFF